MQFDKIDMQWHHKLKLLCFFFVYDWQDPDGFICLLASQVKHKNKQKRYKIERKILELMKDVEINIIDDLASHKLSQQASRIWYASYWHYKFGNIWRAPFQKGLGPFFMKTKLWTSVPLAPIRVTKKYND